MYVTEIFQSFLTQERGVSFLSNGNRRASRKFQVQSFIQSEYAVDNLLSETRKS